MSTEQQQQQQEPYAITTETDAQVKPVPQEHESGEPSNEPVNVTSQEQVEHGKEDATGGTSPSSPKQGSTLLANFPNFLKKPFEKKHEDHAPTEPADTTVTETSDEAADSTTAQPDKAEKRLSRTLMDLIHKKSSKPENHPDPAPVSPEGHETTEQQQQQQQATESPTPSSPSKEPIIDHLRKFFAKKPADGSNASPAADEDTTNAPTSDTTNVTDDNIVVDHPTVPTDLPTEESRPTSLSRRLSKMAQNLTSRIKETNKKQPSTKVEEPIEEAVNSETDNNNNNNNNNVAPEETPLPDSVSNNVLPVPASA